MRLPLVALSRLTAALSALAVVAVAAADDPKSAEPVPAASKISAVTVYQTTALVTREVTLPDAMGVREIVVTPLPPSTMQSSLYAEAGDGVRVLSVRYRSRAIAEDNREEVRKLEAKIKEAQKKLQLLQADVKLADENLKFLAKLESFTAATMTTLTEKGVLDSDKTIALAKHINENRAKIVKEDVLTKQQVEAIQEEMAFTQRILAEKSGGVSRTERDAVILLEKTKAGAATVRLNYLVSAASWKPQYKLRAGTKDGDKVSVEYLASVSQQTGEDWGTVGITLSTAQPLTSASPPDLRSLDLAIGTGPGGQMALSAGRGGRGGQQGGFGGGQAGFAGGGPFAQQQPGQPAAGQGPLAFGGGFGGMPGQTEYLNDLQKQSTDLKRQSAQNMIQNNPTQANKEQNEAAALDQYRDLLISKEDLRKSPAASGLVRDEPSVTYKLPGKLSLPTRSDEQVIEIARLELAPKMYYKAVPVLTPNVYRIADLTNTTEYIFLPGEATMYLNTDFVGQARMPLVVAGKPFTVGFGVDPQLQVRRELVDKGQSIQGGNQVLSFKYRVLLSSYKTAPADVQLWDRVPHADAVNAIAVSLTPPKPALSDDALYVRDEKPKNLLRWDLKVDPKQNADKALAVDYEFKLELDKTVSIGTLMAK